MIFDNTKNNKSLLGGLKQASKFTGKKLTNQLDV